MEAPNCPDCKMPMTLLTTDGNGISLYECACGMLAGRASGHLESRLQELEAKVADQAAKRS